MSQVRAPRMKKCCASSGCEPLDLDRPGQGTLTRYGNTGAGDVKHVRGATGLRLRVGDYRVRFEILESGTLRILHVKHRREAYR